MTDATVDIVKRLQQERELLQEQIVQLQARADAQAALAKQFMAAFEEKPDQLRMDGMEEQIVTLTNELTLAKQATANALHELRSAVDVIRHYAHRKHWARIVNDQLWDCWEGGDSGFAPAETWLTTHAQQTKAPIPDVAKVEQRYHWLKEQFEIHAETLGGGLTRNRWILMQYLEVYDGETFDDMIDQNIAVASAWNRKPAPDPETEAEQAKERELEDR